MKKDKNFYLAASFVVLMALAITITISSLSMTNSANTQAAPSEQSRESLLYP